MKKMWQKPDMTRKERGLNARKPKLSAAVGLRLSIVGQICHHKCIKILNFISHSLDILLCDYLLPYLWRCLTGHMRFIKWITPIMVCAGFLGLAHISDSFSLPLLDLFKSSEKEVEQLSGLQEKLDKAKGAQATQAKQDSASVKMHAVSVKIPKKTLPSKVNITLPSQKQPQSANSKIIPPVSKKVTLLSNQGKEDRILQNEIAQLTDQSAEKTVNKQSIPETQSQATGATTQKGQVASATSQPANKVSSAEISSQNAANQQLAPLPGFAAGPVSTASTTVSANNIAAQQPVSQKIVASQSVNPQPVADSANIPVKMVPASRQQPRAVGGWVPPNQYGHPVAYDPARQAAPAPTRYVLPGYGRPIMSNSVSPTAVPNLASRPLPREVVHRVPLANGAAFARPDLARSSHLPPARQARTSLGQLPQGGAQTYGQTPTPFSISIDGEAVFGTPLGPGPEHTGSSASLSAGDLRVTHIDMSYDRDGVEPFLSGLASHQLAGPRTLVKFQMFSNYHYFIERGEVRLFAPGNAEKPIAVMPLDWSGQALLDFKTNQSLFQQFGAELGYRIRVYDRNGEYDETTLQTLPLSQSRGAKYNQAALAALGRENSREIANIPVRGGKVIIDGNHIPTGYRLWIMGYLAPILHGDRVKWHEIVPAGHHEMMVAVLNPQGDGIEFRQSVSVADQDWYYVALADLTVGQNFANGDVEEITNDAIREGLYSDGRLAFFVRGRIKGRNLLTAAADTGEGPLKDLFSNFLDKDPRALLRRVDPDKYYTVYGDASYEENLTPSDGKFYVRLERDKSYVMWGNFKTSITKTQFGRIDRSLYGGHAHWESVHETSRKQSRVTIDAYGADPGTIAAREEFRGTNGSLFFLRNRDVLLGSERLSIEVRDKETGLVIQTQDLAADSDYDFDTIQGRIILRTPLPSTADDSPLVRAGSLSGEPVFLVVRYEYTPGFRNPRQFDYGGRAEAWLSDWLRVGATGQTQDDSDQRITAFSGDVQVLMGKTSKFEAEVGRSQGRGITEYQSRDGGFSFDEISSSSSTKQAYAYRGELDVSWSDLLSRQEAEGGIRAYFQRRDRGFAVAGQKTNDITIQWGLSGSGKVSDRTKVAAEIEGQSIENDTSKQVASVDVTYEKDKKWSIASGIRHERNRQDGFVNNDQGVIRSGTGSRTDVAVEVTRKYDKGRVYGFAQGSVTQSGNLDRNDRVGAGAELQVTEDVKVNGEASYGTTGMGVKAGVNVQVDEDTEVYASYEWQSERDSSSLVNTGEKNKGVAVVGARKKYSDDLSAFGEEKITHDNDGYSLSHSYGLDWRPQDSGWQVSGAIEQGQVESRTNKDLDRLALTLSGGYQEEGLSWNGSVEGREEDQQSTGRQRSILVRSNARIELDPEWELLADFEMAATDSLNDTIVEGDFVEGSVGFAYRPVWSDRFNALGRYTYVEDRPGSSQSNASGSIPRFDRSAHVLSLDAAYKLYPWWTLGGKYGLRYEKLKQVNVLAPVQTDNLTQLFAIRNDINFLHRWDFMAEGRLLTSDLSQDQKLGAVLALYRHIGENFKLGAGYNFADYNDDLTNLDFNSHGWFINAIGKF